MSKTKQIEEIQSQINALKGELYDLNYDPVQVEIEDELRCEEESLEEWLSVLEDSEDEVRRAKEEVATLRGYIKKLKAQLASHKAKMAKKKKKPKPRK